MCHAGPTVCNLSTQLSRERAGVPYADIAYSSRSERPVRNTGLVRDLFIWASHWRPCRSDFHLVRVLGSLALSLLRFQTAAPPQLPARAHALSAGLYRSRVFVGDTAIALVSEQPLTSYASSIRDWRTNIKCFEGL